ncbi:MAG: DUF2207 domain-containing protein, partial [bacterium]|nr:DUF2207 domain-containing protein [bacterium]
MQKRFDWWGKLSWGLVSLLILLLSTKPVIAAEQINTFSSQITINQNTSITVKESIKYSTDEYRHGIYRYIPVNYSRDNVRFTTRILDVMVLDVDEREVPHEVSFSSGNATLKIGDPDTTFTGDKTYFITYTIENALQSYDDYDELYWDITGEGWRMPILMTMAEVVSPHATVGESFCYAGVVGSDNKLCQIESQTENSVRVRYGEDIEYGDNVTVAVRLQQPNALLFPTASQKLWKSITDQVVFVPLFIPLFFFGMWWWRTGRDRLFVSHNVYNLDPLQSQHNALPFMAKRTPMMYEPIKQLSPGQAGILLDERADNRDVVAEIVELARKKFLKISMIEKKKLLGTEREYEFTKLKDIDPALPAHQQYLLKSIFSSHTTVKLSSLKGSFHTKMEKTKELMLHDLTARKFFLSDPRQTVLIANTIAVIVSVLTFIWMTDLLNQGLFIALPIFILTTVISFLFANALPAKSATGSNLSMQAAGLRQTINRGKWREEVKEKRLFIEDIFPFAISLGVVDRLSRDMESLNLKPPAYFQGVSPSFTTSAFVNSFSSQAASSLSYNPSSSSWSGG